MADIIDYDSMFANASQQQPAQAAEAGPSRSPATQTSISVDFSSSLTAWRDVQLPKVQEQLQNWCNVYVEAQKEALLSRKKLAEQTREYKKLKAEEQPEASKPLLKAYQLEIDSLTKRAKAAESAVLSLRDQLQNATDPYPILEAVVEQTAIVGDLEVLNKQVQQLTSTHADLEARAAVAASLEAEKARLSNKVKQLEQSATEARRNVEAELAAKWDERLRNSKLREESLTKSLEATQEQLKGLRVNYSKATERLLQHGEEVERGHANGNIEELDVISEELSRSNERAASMERRNEQLRQEIEHIKSGAGESEKVAQLERRAYDAEDETRRLSKLMEDQTKRLALQENSVQDRIRELEKLVREKDGENDVLRKRLKSMSDYDEVKRELEIFKYVEFAIEADERIDADNATEQESSASTLASAKPLEALLIEKNRQLQDEITSLRVAHNELLGKFEAETHEFENVKLESTRLKKLNERLEDDLLNIDPAHTRLQKTSAGMSAEDALAEIDKIGAASSDAQSGTVTPSNGAEIPVTSSVAQSKVDEREAPIAKTSSAVSSSILPIITSQRDRFRSRNAELEEELRKQFATITELRNEIKRLQADNLSLYEKVRYLQAYNNSANTVSSGSGIRGQPANSRIVNVAARNDVAGSYPPPNTFGGEDKYREKYEASMNPFEQFRGREHARAVSSLNPLERLLHIGTRIVLGHRRLRIFFVVYALCLHLLVFAMLFEVEFATGSSTASMIPSAAQGRTPA